MNQDLIEIIKTLALMEHRLNHLEEWATSVKPALNKIVEHAIAAKQQSEEAVQVSLDLIKDIDKIAKMIEQL